MFFVSLEERWLTASFCDDVSGEEKKKKKKKRLAVYYARAAPLLYSLTILKAFFFFSAGSLSIRGSTPPHSADLTGPHAVVIHSASPIFPSIKETRTVFYRLCV